MLSLGVCLTDEDLTFVVYSYSEFSLLWYNPLDVSNEKLHRFVKIMKKKVKDERKEVKMLFN